MPNPHQTTNNRRLVFNTWLTGILIPIGLGIFWKCVQIYNVILLQHTVDARQDKDITANQVAIIALTKLANDGNNKDNEQDKDIIKLQAALPSITKYRTAPGY